MKRAWIVSVILSFMSVATGFSAPLSDEALTAILGQPAGAECAQPQESLILPDQLQGIQYKTCSATATCNDSSGVNISCTFGGSGGTCNFQNQDCAAGKRGYVYCNGTRTDCPPCPCGGPNCCICESTGDCYACCMCNGGGPPFQCSQACGGV